MIVNTKTTYVLENSGYNVIHDHELDLVTIEDRYDDSKMSNGITVSKGPAALELTRALLAAMATEEDVKPRIMVNIEDVTAMVHDINIQAECDYTSEGLKVVRSISFGRMVACGDIIDNLERMRGGKAEKSPWNSLT